MKNQWLLIAFIEGALVMLLELIGARFIAPYFGASIVTWTVILSTVIFSLAVGYFIGGKISTRKFLKEDLLKLLTLVFVVIPLLPLIANLLGVFLDSSSMYLGIIIMSMALLVLPNVVFGTISPILIEQIKRESKQNNAGIISGRVYAISTVGGILATYIFGFFIIPKFGLVKPILFFSIIAWVIILFRIYGRSFFKIQYFIPALSFLICLFFGLNKKNKQIKYYSEGLLGQVMVSDIKNDFTGKEDRILFVNRMGQTWVTKESNSSMWNYPHYISAFSSIYPVGSKALLLGLGGGTIAQTLQNLKFDYDVVELDERISDVAQKYFYYNSKNTKIDDARHFIRYSKKNYSLIIFDVFKGEVAPSYVLTKESFEGLKSNLLPGGILMINFNGFVTGKNGIPARSVYKTLKESGYKVKIVTTAGEEHQRNTLFIASLDEIDFSKPRYVFRENNVRKSPVELFVSEKPFIEEGGILLTDDKPNLEILNLNASQSWRNDYKEIFREKLPNNEIPKFW